VVVFQGLGPLGYKLAIAALLDPAGDKHRTAGSIRAGAKNNGQYWSTVLQKGRLAQDDATRRQLRRDG
jgi:hypothetical protein